MQEVTVSDLEHLALGATLLGSGGGGDPSYEMLMAKQQLETYGPVPLVSVDALKDDALVAPLAYMGAPLVAMEKLPSGREFSTILEMLEKVKGKKPTHLLAAEIGGANAFTPIAAAGASALPVLDGDTIGRAFPELQMSSCNLFGISAAPAFLADALDNTMVVKTREAMDVERFCRKITIEMGSSAAVCLYVMNGIEAKRAIVPGSISQAIRIGKVLAESGIEALLRETGGACFGSGMITDIDQRIEEGFLKGTVTIEGAERWRVLYQNEYLLFEQEGSVIAATPDILVLLEQESGRPVTSEALAYGLRVSLVSVPGPEIWYSQKGLAMVGPEYFGYTEVMK